MGNPTYLLLLLLFLHSTDAASCNRTWTLYKDELCFKTFTNLVTYNKAKTVCSFEGGHKASLAKITDAGMQAAVSNYTHKILNSLWVGAKYYREAGQFKWEDGSPLTYTNWEKNPSRSSREDDVCVELRTPNSNCATCNKGSWADVNCQKLNMVLCQSPASWSKDDAINEIIKLRKELEEVNSRVVPIGSIYIEYYNQPRPDKLWPTLKWQDMSNSYAGLFFRVTGGGAASWGTTQTDCAPRINTIDYKEELWDSHTTASVPINGWSQWSKAGVIFRQGPAMFEKLRLHSAYCEVRPKNKAVRVWKRIG